MKAQPSNGGLGSVLAAAVCGLIFGVGLVLSGMTQPSKVIGFLDLFGDWDPSLAFVMGGAVVVHALARPLIMRRDEPLMEPSFQVPTQRAISGQLVVGAGLFGIGWGLVGVCPGPAVVGVASGDMLFVSFIGAMLTGMWVHRFVFPKTFEIAAQPGAKPGE